MGILKEFIDDIKSIYNWSGLQLVLTLLFLYLSSFYGWTLFHSFAEIACVVLAFGIFSVSWYSRRFIDNNYFLLIGVAYFFVAVFDLIHAFSYPGLGIIHQNSLFLSSEFWLVARLMASASFLIATIFISRKIKAVLVFNSYLLVSCLLILLVFYWESINFNHLLFFGGLIGLNMAGEYLIVVLLIWAAFVFNRVKNKFDSRVYKLLMLSLAATIVSEAFIIKQPDILAPINLWSHYFELSAFYLFYFGVVEIGLMKPYKLLFKNLKDHEVALRDSEQRYRDLVELSPETIILHQDRLITYINSAGLKLLGFETADKLLGKDIISLFHEDSRPAMLERLALLKNNATAQLIELKMMRFDGELMDVESTAKRIDEQGKSTILVIIRDITQRKKFEQEVIDKQSFIEKLINATPNILYIYDLFERRFIFINKEITDQLGYRPEQIIKIGRNILQELVHPADFEKVVEHHRQLLSAKAGEIFKIEYRMKDILGNWHWLENFDAVFLKTSTGVTRQIIGTAQDFTSKKQADMELKETQEILQLALNSYPDPFVMYDSKLRYTFVNDAAIKVFNQSQQEIIGHTDQELFTEETYGGYLPLLKKVLEKRVKQSQECQIKFPSGEVIYFVTFVPLFNKAGVIKQIIGSTNDITKSKKAELALRDSEERYRLLVELSPDTLIVHHFGKIVYVNTAGLYLLGAKHKKEVVGKELLDFFHPDFKEFAKARFNQLRNGEEDMSPHDSRIITLDGRSIDIEKKSTIINYQGRPAIQTIIRDITTRKLAIDDASDHVVITDPKGVIIYANKAAERMTGYDRTEMIGQTSTLWGNCVGKDLEQDIKACSRAFDLVKSNPNSSYIGEVVNQRKNGERYIADLHISPVQEHGEIIFYISIERDVTRLKEIDRAKTEFVSLASHQLRTPLTGISLSSELLLRGVAGPVDPAIRPMLEEIYDSSQRMKDLIDVFLNISRIELGTFMIRPEEISLKTEIDQVVESLMLQLENKKLNFNKSYDPNLPNIKFDRNILTIIVENLLTNAIRYTEAGGQVSLVVENKGQEILIKVTDNGCGIPKDQQKKVFSKLFRAENAKVISADGAGLGLYMVKSLVKRVDSRIWLESELGVGTTFFVAIPVK